MVVLALTLSVSAIAAAGAQALEWRVGPEGAANTLAELGLENETVKASLKAGTELFIEGKAGAEEVEIKAKALAGTETKVKKGGSDSGKLSLTELAVVKPATCSISPPITTTELKSELVRVEGVLYDKFSAAAGEVLATVKLTGVCPLAGVALQLKGTVFAEVEPIGAQLVTWPLKFSAAINAAAGGALKMGANPASLTGTAQYELSGGKVGKAMGVGPGVATTKLCKKFEGEKGPCKEFWPAKTSLEFGGTSVIELATPTKPPVNVTLTCEESAIAGETLELEGKPRLGVTLTGVTFAKCKGEPAAAGACEMSGVSNLAGSIESLGNNTNGLWNFPAMFSFKCALAAPTNEVKCELVEATPALALSGSILPTVQGIKKVLKVIKGGVNCPQMVEWSPSYLKVVKPIPLWVVE